MPTIKFLPMDKSVQIAPGESLLEAAHDAGLEIDSACGGMGVCGKCLVRILAGQVDFDNRGLLTPDLIKQGFVLACKSNVTKSDLTVEIPSGVVEELPRGKFVELEEEASKIQQGLLPDTWKFEGFTQQIHVQVPPAQLEDGLSDVDRLTRVIQTQFKNQEIVIPLGVMRKIADTIRINEGKIRGIVALVNNRIHVLDLQAEQTSTEYGIAIDIGTTSIAVQIISLPEAKVIGTYSDFNQQFKCGQDIISRINYAARPEGLQELKSKVVKTINHILHVLFNSHKIQPASVYSAVISGNTTMIHLLLGLKPEYIRIEPYTPTILSPSLLFAHELNIEINPQAIVYLSPAVGSYVGGDITAGVVCTDLDKHKNVSLFIDIGTNGELVIGNNDFLMTCACSAGPAFEGAGLEWGMRAVGGAIDKVIIDSASGEITPNIIGKDKPRGICGSGVISLLAQLFLTGWIDAAGKINRTKQSQFVELKGRTAKFIVIPSDKSAMGRNITISEPEISNIIRAKAAIYSAIMLILKQIDTKVEDLQKVFIGGNFGRYLDLENAIVLGLLPDLPLNKFHYLGNSSLIGSFLVLVSKEIRQRQIELTKKMTYLELNTDQAYMDQFTSASFLPHTDINLFPSVKKKMV